MTPKLVAIVAVARNGVIGANNQIPWRISSDLKRFKALTLGKPLIMGRRNFDSIGRPLPGRETVAISRDPGFAPPGVHVARDPDEAVRIASILAEKMGADEIIVAGGEQIYRALLDRTELIHLTEVALTVAGDVSFPKLDPAEWREISREAPSRGDKDEADFAYVTLERRRD
jgi:dihydrofolate reductase